MFRYLLCAIAIFLTFLSENTFAQRISIGVKGGVPLTNAFDFRSSPDGISTTYSSKTKRYTVGPMVEVKQLPFGFAVEVDALYKHLNYDSTSFRRSISSFSEFFFNRGVAIDRWEFPILLKYQFLDSTPLRAKPYITGGININHVGRTRLEGVTGVRQSLSHTFTEPFSIARLDPNTVPSELGDRTVKGVVVGGGLGWQVPIVHISPELRYTRWSKPNFGSCHAGNVQPVFFCSNVNQFEFLLGIGF